MLYDLEVQVCLIIRVHDVFFLIFNINISKQLKKTPKISIWYLFRQKSLWKSGSIIKTNTFELWKEKKTIIQGMTIKKNL